MMAKKKLQEKRRQRRIKAAQFAKSKIEDLEQLDEDVEDEELLTDLIEEIEDSDDEEDSGAVKKSYDEPTYYATGATSWEEHEVAERMRQNAEKVQELSWRAQDLVQGILYNSELSPQQKADKIKAVGDGFGSRVQAIMDYGGALKELDVDLLECEAMVAKEARSLSIPERVGDWFEVEKGKLSPAARKKLEESDFALPAKRKYPIHDKAHVRNALARAAQMIRQGGEAAEDARAALPKIRSAAKRMKIGMGKASAVVIDKDASGSWRWVGWPSNKFIDFDGDIISEVAHKEYVEWVSKNMRFAPIFMSHHVPGTARTNQVDFVDYQNGFLIMSGPLTEEEAAGLFKVQKEIDLGMSHGTIVLERDANDHRVVLKYRMYEVSDLPLENAANPFTSLETLAKEAAMDKKEYLAKLIGQEKADELLKQTETVGVALQDAGIENKEKSQPVEPIQDATQEQKPVDTETLVKQVLAELDAEGLASFVVQAKEAMEKVSVLEETVKALNANKDEALAEMIAPKAKYPWSALSKSQSDETVISDDDPLAKSEPGIPDDYWLSRATGTAPLKQ